MENLVTQQNLFQKILSTNHALTASYASTPWTQATEPKADGTDGCFKLDDGAVMIVPFGRDSNNDAFDMQAHLIAPLWTSDASTRLWVRTFLFKVTCTLSSTLVGLAGKELVAADLGVDTIALLTTDDPTVAIYSPTGDLPARIQLDHCGAGFIELTFKNPTAGTAGTQANALIRTF
jgi:hypothetical protein